MSESVRVPSKISELTGDVVITTPTDAQLLTYDNAQSKWKNAAAPSSGVPTSRAINTTAPLTGGGDMTADRTHAIAASTNSVDGYLTAADHATFSAKGSGTVTSVGLSLPATFTVTNSPVTGSGTLTGAYANQSANQIFAGPSSGSAAAPTFRALVSADLPATYLIAANNLSDIGVAATAAHNLGLGTADTPLFTAVKIGNADAGLNRNAAGALNVTYNTTSMGDLIASSLGVAGSQGGARSTLIDTAHGVLIPSTRNVLWSSDSTYTGTNFVVGLGLSGTSLRVVAASGAGSITGDGPLIASTGTFSGPVKPGTYTVATLPAGAEGQQSYATNGRKVGELAAGGTGVPVYFSNGSWRVNSTDAAVAA